MSKFSGSVGNVMKGIVQAFFRYPISMVAAYILVLIGSIYVEDNNFFEAKFLTSLQISLMLCGAIGMVLSAAVQKYVIEFEVKIILYISAIGGSVATFLVLYYTDEAVNNEILPRLGALVIICFLLFLVIPSYKNFKYDFNDTVFMNLKGFFIAGIYSLVLLLGLFAVVGAVQMLIYPDLTHTIISHIALFCLFLWYAFYLGHLPHFSEHEADAAVDRAIRQPKFIEILDQYILVPLMGLMSLVLIVWIGRILIFQSWPVFGMVSGIFSTYSILGILLYVLVSKKELRVSQLYRRIFPIFALIFIVFEGFSAWKEISKTGMSTYSYFVILILLGSVAASIVFIFNKVRCNRLVAYILIVMTIVAVLPFVGYKELPKNVNAALGVKVEERWREPDPVLEKANRVWLELEKTVIDLKGYSYSLNVLSDLDLENKKEYKIPNDLADFYVKYIDSYENGVIPRIQVKKNNDLIIDQDLSEYIRNLVEKYATVQSKEEPRQLPVSEMSLIIEKEGIRLKVIFDTINIETYPVDSSRNYYGLGVSQILVGF